jgi:Zn finger protein HypA/HybF involved in hydrogenase expression
MKHCPECTNEFIDETSLERCPDCDVPLLPGPNPRLSGEQRDSEDHGGGGDLKVLTRVLHIWQADLLRGRLEEAGIPTAQNPSSTSAWMHVPPLEVTGSIEILVTPEDYERGLQFLADEPELLFCAECHGQVSPEDETCPHCGRKLGQGEPEAEE